MLSEPQVWFAYSAGERSHRFVGLFRAQAGAGDKDLWRFALLALRKRWAVPGRHVGVVSIEALPGIPFAGHSMLQHSPSGKPLFVHANMLKQLESLGYKVTKGATWALVRRFKFDGDEDDHNVEADHLANADMDGSALLPSHDPLIRRRAVLERGLRFGWGTCMSLSRWSLRPADET